jgi:hypothetical protein
MEKLSPSRKACWVTADEWFGKPSVPTSAPMRSYMQVYSWCRVNYPKSWVDEMAIRIWKWESRIARRLAVLRGLALRRMSAFPSGLVRTRYCVVLNMIVMAESRIAKLACRSAKRIKAHLARLAAALEQCSKPKPNGNPVEEARPMFLSSDDPDYDELWEVRMRLQICAAAPAFFAEADEDENILDEEAIAPHLPQRKRDSVALKRDRAKSSKWGCESDRPHRSWKSRRCIKWRVLGNPSLVLS